MLPDSDEIYELLDRKIPASLMILSQIVANDLQKGGRFEPNGEANLKLLRAIAKLAYTLPSSHLYSRIGSQTLSIMAHPKQAKQMQNLTLLKEFISDLKQICLVQLNMDISDSACSKSIE